MVIGLTGGVATGKSLVASELARLGAHVICADEIAREVVGKGSRALAEIEGAFGGGVIKPDGTLDRKALGAVVFTDPESRRLLESITHPEIIERIRGRVRELKKRYAEPIIVIDAPLLFEVGLERETDRVIVVCADVEEQVRRITSRDGLTVEEARRRIEAQMPLEEKAARADYVIENNGAKEEALARAGEIMEKIRSEAAS